MATIPIEIYEILEKKIGKEDAKKVLEILEGSLNLIEEKAKEEKEIAKIQIRQELTNELITKAEFYSEIKMLENKIESVKSDLSSEIKRLENKISTEIKRLEDKISTNQTIMFFFIPFVMTILLSIFGILVKFLILR